MSERRNDLGGKILVGILIIIISGLMSKDFFSANKTADRAFTKACAAEVVNSVQDQKMENFKEHLNELRKGQHEIKNILLSR